MNRPGGLFNIGCLVANAHVVLEGSRRMAAMEVEQKKGKKLKKKDTAENELGTAINAFDTETT